MDHSSASLFIIWIIVQISVSLHISVLSSYFSMYLSGYTEVLEKRICPTARTFPANCGCVCGCTAHMLYVQLAIYKRKTRIINILQLFGLTLQITTLVRQLLLVTLIYQMN